MSYILLIFTSPQIAAVFENILWINWFNEFVKSFKSWYDDTVTDIPTNNELINTYKDVVDTTNDLSNHFVEWVSITKTKIDNFREDLNQKKKTVEELKQSYEKIKESYEDVKEIIDTASGTIQNTRNTINNLTDITDTFTNTWIINN